MFEIQVIFRVRGFVALRYPRGAKSKLILFAHQRHNRCMRIQSISKILDHLGRVMVCCWGDSNAWLLNQQNNKTAQSAGKAGI